MAQIDESALWPAGERDVSSRLVQLRSNLRVRIVESGPPEGSPVLLVGGWATSAYLYRKNLLALAAAGSRAIALDLPGQGRSDKPEAASAYSLDALARSVLEALDALDIPETSIVGQSLGGAIAMHVALMEPRRISRLALISPVGLGRVRAARLGAMLLRPWMAPVAAHLFTRRSFAIGLRIAHGRGARRAERDIEEYYAAARDPRFIRSLIHLVHEIDWDPLPLAELRSIHAPVLVIAGRQDRIIPPRNLEQVVREIPTSRLVLLPEAGHMSNEEAPELVNPLLVGFLRPGAAP